MKKIIIYEYLVYFSLVSMILTIVVWNSFIAPSENIPRILPTIIYNIPLLIMMFKLRKNKFNTYIMLSYLMLLYFVIGIGNITNENTIFLGIVISLLSLLVFIGSILYVRKKNEKTI
tara:strand:- start:1405 stop:1755 length:351 start_codon:yes stop_codon:yes gene_type:complete